MELVLNNMEMRVIGCLIEKEMTTPEYYPLSLNALTNACNQKSNRSPVINCEETDVVRALDRLRHKGLAMVAGAESCRVPKYRHNLAEKLHLEPYQLALLAELLLRGAQTLGELRGRADRIYSFKGLEQVEAFLDEMMEPALGLAVKLPRQTGQKECRYMHLLGGTPSPEEIFTSAPATETATLQVRAENERIEELEKTVAVLRSELDDLRAELASFRSQFE